MVLPWKPPSLSGKPAVSITLFREGLKQGSLGFCDNYPGV